MSDCEEENNFFWGSWSIPEKRQRKKGSKKGPESKNDTGRMETDGNMQKKKKRKKKSKFKEAMEGRKEKKIEKKKKKQLETELDNSLMFPQGGDLDYLTQQDSKMKSKRQKKVEFNLSPENICIKRPQFTLSSVQPPEESAISEIQDNNDSQCTNNDINSQDLFITQKTFRESPSQPSSSCETQHKTINTTPQMFPCLSKSVAWMQQGKEGQDSLVQQQYRKKVKLVQKPPKTVTKKGEAKEEKGLCKAHQNRNKGKITLQINTNLTTMKKAPRPVHAKPGAVNPYLVEPVDLTASLEDAKSKIHSKQSLSFSSASTQTENFFTAELSSYLNFCRNFFLPVHIEDLKPLDLTVAHRVREDIRRSTSRPGESYQEPKQRRHLSVGRKACSVSEGETTPSPQSQSEPKYADTTTSSEDNEPLSRHPCKIELAQARVVQTRLNGSFFFKTRGDGQSPRAASPLVKLCPGQEPNSKKAH